MAIGAGISLFVGLLRWPRGAVSVLRREIGAAYTTAARFLGDSIAAAAPTPRSRTSRS